MMDCNDHPVPSSPVRRIPINTRSLTGDLLGQEFESSLERDLLLLMAWEDDLDWFQVQPVTIRYLNSNGHKLRYTPDLFVHFQIKPETAVETHRKHLLCEVKYREDLSKNWKALKQKFKAARAYAKRHGWVFKIFTEDRIRTPRLQNIQFLWGNRVAPIDLHHHVELTRTLARLGPVAIEALLDSTYPSEDRYARAEGTSALWCLLATKAILCDLNTPLSMKTTVWLA